MRLSMIRRLKQKLLNKRGFSLAETLMALIGEHHGESAKAQKLGIEIIKHIPNILIYIKSIFFEKLPCSNYLHPYFVTKVYNYFPTLFLPFSFA